MANIKLDSKAPAFNLPSTGDKKTALKSLLGSYVVLYFYPRDNTPGCSTESSDFAAANLKFKRRSAIVLGVSQDTIASHDKFKSKFDMPFDLLSDEDGTVCRKYDVIKWKNMYGKKFEGIERSTFLIDDKGVLRELWRKVKVPGHVDEVLDALKTLQSE